MTVDDWYPDVSMFRIGEHTIDPPLVLAPMEDVTSQPMRRIAKRIAGPGLMVTEFVSAMAIHHGAKKTLHKMRLHEEERPVAIQIFGGEPNTMAETARVCEEMGADIVDINMGCWVPKVCKTGAGAALLKDPELAEKIVRAVIGAVKVPVTVKVRAGWDYSLFAAPDLVRRFQDAGARALTLHARFAKQGFEGEADWRLIGALRDAVTVPLIGNGDVKTPGDAVRMLRETGCDGVMVGRAAISNPWRLKAIREGIEAYQAGRPFEENPEIAVPIGERVRTALDHIKMTVALETESDPQGAELRACRSLRGQIPLYIKGEIGASQLREKLTRCSTVSEYEALLDDFAATVGR